MKKFISYLILSVSTLLTTNLWAAPVSINEIFYSPYGEYGITNNTSETITAFIVGNNDAVATGVTNLPGEENLETGVVPWGHAILTRESPPPADISFVNWDDPFFSAYTQVVAYWKNPTSFNVLTPGSTAYGFLFISEIPASAFRAYGDAGGIFDGETSLQAVPIPASFFLLVLTLPLIGFFKRKA